MAKAAKKGSSPKSSSKAAKAKSSNMMGSQEELSLRKVSPKRSAKLVAALPVLGWHIAKSTPDRGDRATLLRNALAAVGFTGISTYSSYVTGYSNDNNFVADMTRRSNTHPYIDILVSGAPGRSQSEVDDLVAQLAAQVD